MAHESPLPTTTTGTSSTPAIDPNLNGEGESTIITYRHVLSQGSVGSRNPLRVIAHCDIDAAYAQFEMVRLGIAEDKPVAVQQWGGLIAINYPARKYGISRMDHYADAKKKCPDLICVHVATYKEGESEAGYYEDPKPETHKVSLDPYRRESLKILNLFSQFCPNIQKASIDEAFLDFTIPVRDALIERYPQLASLPADSPMGLDTPLPPPPEDFDWGELGHLIPTEEERAEMEAEKDRKMTEWIVRCVAFDDEGGNEDSGRSHPESSPAGEAAPSNDNDVPSIDSGNVISEPVPKGKRAVTWNDIALAIGAEMMHKCRASVKSTLGYTCSAGIARNKMLAKLCSAWKKPNAQTILRDNAISSFLRPLKFQKIRFLGGKLGVTIAELYDAKTVGDLWTVSLAELQNKLGEDSGIWVYEIIRGIDYSEVEQRTQTKSMLSSKNFRPSISKLEEGVHWLKVLSTELHVRLTEARELAPGVWPKTISLHHRNDNYVSRARQHAFPYTSKLTPEYVFKFAEKLLREIVGEKKGENIGKITNLALQFNGLDRLEAGQKGIEGFFASRPGGTSQTTSLTTLKRSADALEEDVHLASSSRHSENTHAVTKKAKVDNADRGDRDPAQVSTGPDRASPERHIEPDAPTYTCPRCSKTFSISLPVDLDEESARHAVDVAMETSKREHEDYHFARDLLEEERRGGASGSALAIRPPDKSKQKSKPKVKDKGGKGGAPKGQQSLADFFGSTAGKKS